MKITVVFLIWSVSTMQSDKTSPTRPGHPERPREAGAPQRKRSQSDCTAETHGLDAPGSVQARLSKEALALQAHDAEATDKCMPLHDDDVQQVGPVRKSARRWSVTGAENGQRRPPQTLNRSITTGQLKPPSRGSSRASPVSPGSPAARLPESRFSHRALEDGIREAFSSGPDQQQHPPQKQQQTWLMADGELPGLPNHQRTTTVTATTPTSGGVARIDLETNDWQAGAGGTAVDRHRVKSGPSSKIGRASSFRDELLSKREHAGSGDQHGRRAVKQNTLFAQNNGDIEPFQPSRRPASGTRRSSADSLKTTSTLPAIPRGITSATRTRSQKAASNPSSSSGVGTAANGISGAGRPHTTLANGRRLSANSGRFITTIDGLSDLPPDGVIHEVIRVLRNLHVEDWEPRGYDAVLCTWFETQFEISVLDESGMCSLCFERQSGSGSSISFREACEQITSALRVYTSC